MTLDVRCWHEADVNWERRGVRFQGESGHDADWMSLPSLTQSGHCCRLLDHLVGAGCLVVDNQLELGRLLDWTVGRLGALQHAIDITRWPPLQGSKRPLRRISCSSQTDQKRT